LHLQTTVLKHEKTLSPAWPVLILGIEATFWQNEEKDEGRTPTILPMVRPG
jgi:hypothetical protein